MGNHMADNLMKSGHSLIVHDKDSAAVEKMVAMGAEAAENPASVAMAASTIITMLPSSPHVQDVYRGANGIISTVKENSLLIDSSTIDPAVTKDIASELTAKNINYLDAPVSGGMAINS